ncbi:MAG: tetratricopeptide repeat protein [Phycisphaerae bacterium]
MSANQTTPSAPSPTDSSEVTPLQEFLAKPWVRRWGPFLAIAFLAFLFYLPTLRGMYIWDDDQWLTDNPTMTAPDGLSKIWTDPQASPQYYPLVFTTFWIEHKLWGFGSTGPDGVVRPVGYHFDNLLMHIGSALLIFGILRRMKLPGGDLGAWLAALLFAIHPVNVESVAWVSERKNCLSGLLFFASLYYALRFFAVTWDEAQEQSTGTFKDNWPWYSTALLLFLGSMLAKTAACVLPPVILLLIWWRRGKIRWREVALSLPFFLIAIALGAITAGTESTSVGAIGPDFQFSFLQRLLIAGNALPFYLSKLLWPNTIVQIYPRFPIVAGHPLATPAWLWIAPLAYVAFLVLLWAFRKKISRGPLAAMLFFTGVLFPTLGFINYYTMIYTFVADHFQYFACIGIIVLVVETLLWAVRRAPDLIPTEDPERFRRLVTGLIFAGITLSLGTRAYGVATLYTNRVGLWEYNADVNPNSFIVWDNVAGARLLESPPDRDGAKAAYLKAIEAGPQDWRAYHKLGQMYLTDNNPDEAAKFLYKAEQLMPDFVRNGRAKFLEREAARADQGSPEQQEKGVWDVAHGPEFLLARNYEDHAQWDAAIAQYQKDLQKFPQDAAAWFGMGNCFMGRNDFTNAAAAYQKAIDLRPKYAAAYLNLGLALGQLHRDKEALAAIQTARQIDPTVIRRIPGLLEKTAEQMRAAQTQK